jgi:hypothetical protein
VDTNTDGDRWIAQLRGRWWILHTRAQNEKRVAAELARNRCQYYLPLVRVRHTYTRSRTAVCDKPLFPGDLFLCGAARAREIAGDPNRVEGVVLQWCGRTKLYVGVSLISQSATVEIDAALLEVLA